ncbi:hypothetical protein TDMWS_21540 [Thermodesulfomicrobium sp. WS]|nr:hypothetical protein TDMWS_21540 [Thermodesulfomicrobium sp. WS]
MITCWSSEMEPLAMIPDAWVFWARLTAPPAKIVPVMSTFCSMVMDPSLATLPVTSEFWGMVMAAGLKSRCWAALWAWWEVLFPVQMR